MTDHDPAACGHCAELHDHVLLLQGKIHELEGELAGCRLLLRIFSPPESHVVLDPPHEVTAEELEGWLAEDLPPWERDLLERELAKIKGGRHETGT